MLNTTNELTMSAIAQSKSYLWRVTNLLFVIKLVDRDFTSWWGRNDDVLLQELSPSNINSSLQCWSALHCREFTSSLTKCTDATNTDSQRHNGATLWWIHWFVVCGIKCLAQQMGLAWVVQMDRFILFNNLDYFNHCHFKFMYVVDQPIYLY